MVTSKLLRITGMIVCLSILLVSCNTAAQTPTAVPTPVPPTATPLPTAVPPTVTPSPEPSATPSPTPKPLVPDFKHIIVIFFENHEFTSVIGNTTMPNYNLYASQNTLLTQYYAIMHPSLPNYLAVFGGDTFNIKSDCGKCFVSAENLADQIEASRRTWRAYFQDMPSPCFVGDTAIYVQKHNPFMYFDDIRLDTVRCENSVVPLEQLDTDLANGTLPNFVYIMPNSCVSTDDDFSNPDCNLALADNWLSGIMNKLIPYLNQRAATEPYLIVLTWDEGQGSHSCCGLPNENAGGRVPTVLISPLAKGSFQDDTPYTHYSLLKTIETAWNLPLLGHAADDNNVLITAPWK
ncbi:MAG TPA: alkaline phosphatase family protein [Longilinea sp.]|nr:alkaline phosphatase family protein [Longilinea sp.]